LFDIPCIDKEMALILETMKFDKDKISFKGDSIKGKEKEFWQWYRQLIMDGLLPIGCITAYDIIGSNTFSLSSIGGIKENLFEIIKNLSLVRFKLPNDTESIKVDTVWLNGAVYSDMLGDHIPKPLNTVYLFTTSIAIRFSFVITTNTGYRRTKDNKHTSDKKMKPIASAHDFSPFIRIKTFSNDDDNNFIINQAVSNELDLERFRVVFKRAILNRCGYTNEVEVICRSSMSEVLCTLSGLVDQPYKRAVTCLENDFKNYCIKFGKEPHFEYFEAIYIGKDREHTISNLASVKGVSRPSAINMFDAYLYRFLGG